MAFMLLRDYRACIIALSHLVGPDSPMIICTPDCNRDLKPEDAVRAECFARPCVGFGLVRTAVGLSSACE